MMIIKASDGKNYANPKMGGQGWMICFPDLEDPIFRITGTGIISSRKRATKILAGVARLKTEEVEQGILPLPLDWKMKKCIMFRIDSFKKIVPVEWILDIGSGSVFL